MSDDIITELGLEPHPEGGWYRETYAAKDPLETEGGLRSAATLIYYYLRQGEYSAWHVVSSDEVWLWHGPGALELEFGGEGESPVEGERKLLAAPGVPGAAQQILIPGGVWQRTTVVPEPVLVSCMVTPGFDFADWRLEA